MHTSQISNIRIRRLQGIENSIFGVESINMDFGRLELIGLLKAIIIIIIIII